MNKWKYWIGKIVLFPDFMPGVQLLAAGNQRTIAVNSPDIYSVLPLIQDVSQEQMQLNI